MGLELALGLGQGLWRADPPPGELPGGLLLLVVLVVVLTPQLLPGWGSVRATDWGARGRGAVLVTAVAAREDGERALGDRGPADPDGAGCATARVGVPAEGSERADGTARGGRGGRPSSMGHATARMWALRKPWATASRRS